MINMNFFRSFSHSKITGLTYINQQTWNTWSFRNSGRHRLCNLTSRCRTNSRTKTSACIISWNGENMAGKYLFDNAWRGGTKCFPEYVLKLEGMARGLQVEYETLLIWNCLGDLPLSDDAIQEYAKHSPEGCTTHLYPATKSSVAVIAHSEGGPPELDGHWCWLSVRKGNGSKFSTFHYPGMLPGHMFSVNSYELVQTTNNFRVDDLQSEIPPLMLND